MSSVEEKHQKSKFPKLYKFLKETYLQKQDSETNSFIELTQIFSIPIFYRVLFIFTINKALILGSFFIFSQTERSDLITSLVFLELTISFLSTQQQSILKLENQKFYKFRRQNFFRKNSKVLIQCYILF